ncbi:MAG: extracellular solute-binding protein [Anaerolineae bacterium]|nr:extracellular solute-binding protein [Anaerolineae bacterium]
MSTFKSFRGGLSRREFLKATAAAAAAAAVGSLPSFEVFAKPTQKISGELKILQWSHFVPNHDTWFDKWAMEWGNQNGVTVTVDHINNADIPARATAEINAKEGHDLIEYIFPPSALEPSVLDLTDVNEEAAKRHGTQVDLCKRATYNPVTNKYFGFSHGWVPDPGNYRKSLWEQVGLPNGPSTWDELYTGGKEIKDKLGVQMGIGMSNEIDSNMAGRGIIWSFGGAEQDADSNVTLNSPETIAAVEYMKKLYEGAMTPEVFSWNAASNNQLLVAGQASWILNSISAFRTAQDNTDTAEVAKDIYFTGPLKGPNGLALVSEHLVPIYILPSHAKNPDAAKEFMLALVGNYNQVVYESKLYNFPAFFSTAPQLMEDGGWLDNDPYGAGDKLKLLKDAESWSTVIGHPGPAHAGIGEAFGTFVIPTMYAKAAKGEATAEEAVTEAHNEYVKLFDKWRAEGLVGGTK